MRQRGISLAVDNGDQAPMQASNGATVTIDEDGGVTISPPTPAVKRSEVDLDKFEANLAEGMADGTRMNIATDVLDGIASDILSRSDFVANYNKGINLLGLKIEDASSSRGNRSSISRVKNPALLKACVRSQSLTRSQLLPAAGPCKVQTISGESGQGDQLGKDFQDDFNYFLSKVDKGYYADVNKSLFYRAFGGSVYRKIYRDPILKRPTSRFVPLEYFIVSEDVSDHHDALRKTNEMLYNRVQVRRMQSIGGWLDVELGPAMQNINPARQKILQSQGLSAATMRPEDTSHTIYETCVFLQPSDYNFDEPKGPEDQPLPYRVVIDRDSRQLLAMHRNWKPKDELFLERQMFVKYGLVSGLGFLDYGFLHLLGNQVRVLTAIWQILVDKGMLGNFPGGLKAKGVRTSTNELNPGMGEWVEVDIGSIDDIRKALMAMPYGEISAVFIQLLEIIQKDVDSMGGVMDIPTGSGSANMPVGTILALVEQQAQDLTAVQQNDHRSQEEELRLIRDLFLDHPEDLKHLKRPGSKRTWADLVDEFEDMDLVPASDPNIPSQSHRILINQFLMELAEKSPILFGSRLQKLAKRIMQSVGVNDADDLLAPPAEFAAALAAQQKGKPAAGGNSGGAALAKTQMELPLKQAEIALEGKRVELEEKNLQRQAANEAGDQRLRGERQATELAHAEQELQHERAKIGSDTAVGLADAAAVTRQGEADARVKDAQAFAAMGAGAAAFAKAGETENEGVRDLARLSNELDTATVDNAATETEAQAKLEAAKNSAPAAGAKAGGTVRKRKKKGTE